MKSRRLVAGASVAGIFAGMVAATLAVSPASAGIGAAQSGAAAQTAAACTALAALMLPDAVVHKAEAVPGPSFATSEGPPLTGLPAFCRVAAVAKPAINFEVWLPLAGWNGRFQVVGNGANAGSISYSALAVALRRGYAAASTDTGHATRESRDATWALGHPDLVADFGYRSMHLTTEHGKKIVQAFYREPARKSVLRRLFDRRSSRHDGGATLSRRLRRPDRRCAGDELDTVSGRRSSMGGPGDEQGSGKLHPRQQAQDPW